MNEILRFLGEAVTNHPCSDIHIEQGRGIKLRMPGGWQESSFGEVDEDLLSAFLQSVDKHWRNVFSQGRPISVTLDLDLKGLPNLRYRCFAYTIDCGRRIAASLRPIQPVPLPLEKLGLPPLAMTFANAPKGLLLVTGPTGSGKTTTIMAMLAKILAHRPAHVVTIEDPIEFLLPHGEGIATQREVGIDTESFASGLKEALRQRPDVVMVGEIRDQDTAMTALRAAESGHFVVATMHARSAVGAVQKLRLMAEADAVILGNALCGVLAQTLLPTRDRQSLVLASELVYCAQREVQAAIREEKWSALEDMLKRGDKGHCVGLNNQLNALVRNNVVSREEAVTAAYDPAGLAP